MLMLVDAPGLWYRAFHALPSSIRSPQGEPVNAVRGFCDGLATLLRAHRPTRLVCALDFDWRPNWRVQLLPGYKAHRVGADGAEDAPEKLGPQVDIIMDVLTAFGISTAGAPEYEADDVLATLAARANTPTVVVTGDRDLFQLVDDAAKISVVYLGKGIAKAETFDSAAVRARFNVEPDQYVDFAVLRGDPSDGIPGVKGIGDKTAADLLGRHGRLEALIAAVDDPDSGLTTRVRTTLRDHGDYLAAAPTVVRTVTDAPVALDFDAAPSAPLDPSALQSLAQRHGLANPIDRLQQALEHCRR